MHSLLIIVGPALVLAFLLRALVEFRVVSCGSMIPTLYPGDRILVLKMLNLFRPAQCGDIVILRVPSVNHSATRRKMRSRELIKRVVADEHDTVSIARGIVFVNSLPDLWFGENPTDVRFAQYVVPEGSLFVLGDNLAISHDSRNFGPVEKSLLVGRALAVYWPVTRIRLLRGGVGLGY